MNKQSHYLNSAQDDPDIEFFLDLVSEVRFFAEAILKKDTQPLRRAYCRAVFQFVDGVATELKNTVAQYESPELIGDYYYSELKDEKRKIDSNGAVKIIKRYKGFEENLYFAFDIYGWTTGGEFNIKENPEDWKRFRRCISIRNRVVHPKNRKDLFVSDRDLSEMSQMAEWLKESVCYAHLKSAEANISKAEAICIGWKNKHGDPDGDIEKRIREAKMIKKTITSEMNRPTTVFTGRKRRRCGVIRGLATLNS
jgi:hypothetical protein